VRARWLILFFALAGSCALALSVHRGHWWEIDNTAIGPFGWLRCFEHDCETGDLRRVGNDLWTRLGKATWAGGLIAMIALLALAAAVAAKRRPVLVAKTSLVALATATAAGIAFVVMFPGLAGAEIGHGVWLFGAGIVAGTIAAIGVVRAR
jgi:hypothetical protein